MNNISELRKRMEDAADAVTAYERNWEGEDRKGIESDDQYLDLIQKHQDAADAYETAAKESTNAH